ncbi:MAG: hypothetical protein ACE361_26475 [Aureliella sp.]
MRKVAPNVADLGQIESIADHPDNFDADSHNTNKPVIPNGGNAGIKFETQGVRTVPL